MTAPGFRTALASAGWHPGRTAPAHVRTWLLETMAAVSADGVSPWGLSAAASRVIGEFGGLTIRPVPPGAEAVAHGCTIDPRAARHATAGFTEFAERLGARVFPLGVTDDGAMLAVDEHERIFRLGQGGWWYLGSSAPEGLARLVEGHRPARVDETGHWEQLRPLPRQAAAWSWQEHAGAGGSSADRGLRTAMVVAFLLHRAGLLAARRLRFTAVDDGRVPIDQVFRLGAGNLEEHAAAILAEVGRQCGRPAETVRIELHGASPSAAEPAGDWSCVLTTSGDGRTGLSIGFRGECAVPEASPAFGAALSELNTWVEGR
ncbi:SUKH-3 domain-containing protein [Kitasatospora sp. NPDC088134]|uniref:SUKH-3 domain-containing protein n=1 Tax=Kitasatospora sp. NPDC088134 TaxID=3364071 RepID=UPI0037F6F05A